MKTLYLTAFDPKSPHPTDIGLKHPEYRKLLIDATAKQLKGTYILMITASQQKFLDEVVKKYGWSYKRVFDNGYKVINPNTSNEILTYVVTTNPL